MNNAQPNAISAEESPIVNGMRPIHKRRRYIPAKAVNRDTP